MIYAFFYSAGYIQEIEGPNMSEVHKIVGQILWLASTPPIYMGFDMVSYSAVIQRAQFRQKFGKLNTTPVTSCLKQTRTFTVRPFLDRTEQNKQQPTWQVLKKNCLRDTLQAT